MEKIKILNEIQEIYNNNGNIIDYLRSFNGDGNNALEDIMISYDFQAGTYIKMYKENLQKRKLFSANLAEVIASLGNFSSLLEAGVGEGTTLTPLLSALPQRPPRSFGFDISWSRIKYAYKFAKELDISNIDFFTGDLFCTPLKDNSIDVVYTCHSIEPNGGREKEALTELYRITNKYLILLEPSFELASDDAKERMIRHGYVTQLYRAAQELGYRIIEHRLFDISNNPLNPTGIIIIEKEENRTLHDDPICCPITKTTLLKKNDVYYSKESFLIYPIIENIPCLLPNNAIIATKFLEE